MTNTPAISNSSTPGLPAFLTVEEAAAIIRIGRTAAYQLARQYELTDGAQGLPVVRIGRSYRVPLARLEVWAASSIGADQLRTRSPLKPTSAMPGKVEADKPKAVPVEGRVQRLDRSHRGKGKSGNKSNAEYPQQCLPFAEEAAENAVAASTVDGVPGADVAHSQNSGDRPNEVDTLAPGVRGPRLVAGWELVGESRC